MGCETVLGWTCWQTGGGSTTASKQMAKAQRNQGAASMSRSPVTSRRETLAGRGRGDWGKVGEAALDRD